MPTSWIVQSIDHSFAHHRKTQQYHSFSSACSIKTEFCDQVSSLLIHIPPHKQHTFSNSLILPATKTIHSNINHKNERK